MLENITLQFRVEKSFQGIVAMYPQYMSHALYAKGYGMSPDRFFKMVEELEGKKTKAKRLRVRPKQWEAWTWHERVVAIEAGFDPGHTRREAFEDVKGWLAHHGDPIDTAVTKDALQHFDNKAIDKEMRNRAEQRVRRAENKKREDEERLEEYRRLVRRVQSLTDLRERETEMYLQRIRDLKSKLEEAYHPVLPSTAIRNVTYSCPSCGGPVKRGGCLVGDAPYFCPKQSCAWEGDGS